MWGCVQRPRRATGTIAGRLAIREEKIGNGTRLSAFEKVVETVDFGDIDDGHRLVTDGFRCLAYVLGGERQGTAS